MRTSHTKVFFLLVFSLFGSRFTAWSAEKDSLTYEIAKIDRSSHRIQRLFIVIDSANVNDFKLIQEIVFSVCMEYGLDNKTNLSFFCDEKYANYKDILFFRNKEEANVETYKKWMNYYYLGEFEFETKDYTTYPANRNGAKTSETVKILGCP